MSPQSTPSRSSRRIKGASAAKSDPKIASPLGVYDTNCVRDRVRQWQAQGGGVIEAEDNCTSDYTTAHSPASPLLETRTHHTSSRRHAGGNGDDKTPNRSGRAPSCISGNGDQENRTSVRSGSTPAKRVVSDAHWRRERSPPDGGTPSKAAKQSLGQAQTDSGARETSTPNTRSWQRRRRESRRTPPSKGMGDQDGQDQAQIAPPRSQEHVVQMRSGKSAVELSKKENLDPLLSVSPSTRAESETYLAKAEDGKRGIPSPGSKEARSRRSSRQDVNEDNGLSRSPLTGGGSVRSSKGNFLTQFLGERKIFTNQGQEPLVTPRLPSIEAWLKETSDPFLEVDDDRSPSCEKKSAGLEGLPDETPTEDIDKVAPLKPSRRKKKNTPEKEVNSEDPNRIWESLDTKEGTRRAVNGSTKRRRIPSSAIYQDNPFPAGFDSQSNEGTITASKIVDLVRSAPESPNNSLRRRGARKSISSPARNSPGRHVQPIEEDDSASFRSSRNSESSVEGPDPKNPYRPPGIDHLKRPFPSTGKHRLSTIASVETFDSKLQAPAPSISDMSVRTARPPPIYEGEILEHTGNTCESGSLDRKNSRLTKHADLISVLSLPRAGNKSVKSARSIRTNRSRLATATTGDLMQELTTDEDKYMRELRTLVDGVIPVLLTCVLSKSDSAVAAGLFQSSASTQEDANFTKPIVDMGIALERLKTLHKRIPREDPMTLLTWAHGAQRVYIEYLKAWRMGFQDVVVNLAPAADESSSICTPQRPGASDHEEGMSQNEDGDVVNGDGERVDVAFLLKRPLVRLKYLAKTLKGINIIRPSAEAENLAARFQGLVEDARRRSNEERARLEDEAASNIDSTRTRDPRTLAPLVGVTIDRSRRVRARDHFNLALQHSSGQRVDCRVELLLRDEATDVGSGGDLLICEIDESCRWLLFPPIQFNLVSARNGDVKGEIVLMIRGLSGNGSEWQELFSLTSVDEQVGFEWVQMLGLIPVPPKISRSQSFISKHQRNKSSTTGAHHLNAPTSPAMPGKSRTPSPREVQVPIGEQAKGISEGLVEHPAKETPLTPVKVLPIEAPKSTKKPKESSPSTPLRSSNNYVEQVNDLRSLPSQNRDREAPRVETIRAPRSFKEALGLSGTSTSVGLRRTRAKRISRLGEGSPNSPRSKNPLHENSSQVSSPDDIEVHQRDLEQHPGNSNSRSISPKIIDEHDEGHRGLKAANPTSHRSTSSVPSMDLPYIPKARKDSPPTTPIIEPEEEPVWSTPAVKQHTPKSSRLVKKSLSSTKSDTVEESQSPPTPRHREQSPIRIKKSKTPILESSRVKSRRSSSPLKHEYEPSSASESTSDSDASTVERKDTTSISDSSEDEEIEDGDSQSLLMPLDSFKRLSKPPQKASLFTNTNGSIKPSESASQAPYRTVPAQPAKAAKTIASIFSWSDTGSWQSLHPDECSIVITAGLIEAFEMSAAHSETIPLSVSEPVVDTQQISELASDMTSQNDNVRGDRPLVALELTPLVPLRRGTAIDISIRSPPTANSQITSCNNIMFRSRNPGECEALYALINHSRINNPTFIALQNARGPYGGSGSPYSASMDRRTSNGGGSSRNSWFGGWGRSSSYRASSAPTPSIAPSESSIGSMSSAFSALRRFGRAGGGGMFNISRSTISSRVGSRTNSVYTSSDNSSGSGASSPIPPIPPGSSIDARKDAPIGLSNAKIRIYIRETVSKWRDMGSARLTIMRAERNNLGPDGRPLSSGVHQTMHEKRILVNGKTKGEVLLDVQLGESCFERVGRTGIAVSVWEDIVGPNGEVGMVGAVGGVAGGRAKIYMIQMKSEAETAYTFSIVGKLRY